MIYVFVPNSKSVVHFPLVDLGWWLTIHGISTGLNFMIYVYMPNSKPILHLPLVDFGLWVTILWMVGDHPGDGGDHPHFTWF